MIIKYNETDDLKTADVFTDDGTWVDGKSTAIEEEMEDFLSTVIKKTTDYQLNVLKVRVEELIDLSAKVKSVGDDICKLFEDSDEVYDILNKIEDREITDSEDAFQELKPYLT